MPNNKNLKFSFFGVGPLAESVLYSLSQNDFLPSLAITTPDKASGRHLEIQKNIIVSWCEMKNIKCWQPNKGELTKENLENFCKENEIEIDANKFDVFIVASYPKILSKEILDIPSAGTINVHPSLLPKYRGPSPIQSALLNGDDVTGVTIIKLDEDMDHGPILMQNEIAINSTETNATLEKRCGIMGGEMLSQILEHFVNGNLKLKDQDHEMATFTRKFEKKDGEINLFETDAIELQNKFRALLPHIPIYFFIKKLSPLQPSPKGEGDTQNTDKLLRVKITEINLDKDFAINKKAKDIIQKLTPENKSEMSFEDFERGYLR